MKTPYSRLVTLSKKVKSAPVEEVEEPAIEVTASSSTKGKGPKKVFLKNEDAQKKIEELEKELPSIESKNKRKRVLAKIVQLKKALTDENLLVDPEEYQRRLEEKKEKRIQKKIGKKGDLLKEIKAEKKKLKKKACLACKAPGHMAYECPNTQVI